MTTPRGTATVAALLLAIASAACSSADKKDPNEIEVEDLDPITIQEEEVPIGKFLADMDLAMRAWTNLTHTASTEEERRQARNLETVLRHRAETRIDDLIEQLEVGPRTNRVRAASGLGFSGSPKALSPLLAALSDPAPDVVHNALLGLALLELPETPLEEICALMTSSQDAHTRSNAAYAMRSIIEAGGGAPCASSSARLGLIDPEPMVRVQAALMLGLQADAESVERLGDLLYDDTPLVAQAAVEALLLIAEADGINRGPVVRTLLPAMDKSSSKVQPYVRRALLEISDRDYGKETADWMRWAEGLP
jgi:HEAT repeat protein